MQNQGAAAKNTVNSASSGAPIFPNFNLTNLFNVPPLTPEALKGIRDLINSTAKSLSIQNSISNMMESAMQKRDFSQFRIQPFQLNAAAIGRQLRQIDEKPQKQQEVLVEVTAADLVAALDKIMSAAATIGCPKGTLEVSSSHTELASSKRRLLTTTQSDISTIAAQLQKQAADAAATFKEYRNGAIVAREQAQKELAARATGLRTRYEALKARIEAASQNSSHRRLLQEDDVIGDEDGSFQGPPHSRPKAAGGTTMIIVMQPADSAASMNFIEDVLGFLMDIVRASVVPGEYSSEEEDAWADGEYFEFEPAVEDVDAWEEDSTYPAEEAYPENSASDLSNNEPSSEDGSDELLDRRRRMLSSNLNTKANTAQGSGTGEKVADYEYDEDAAYAEEDEWLWATGDEDWMSSEASLEEAVLRYADEANESEILDLVVRLVSPTQEGGISPALMHILADPQGSSVAQLLKELAAGPAGSELSVAKYDAEMPRFAVFGPSVQYGFSQAAAVGAHVSRPHPAGQDANGNPKVVDMMVGPLRGPKPHTDRDLPSGMDARWWGVVLGLGGLGLLLVGAALAAMRRYVNLILSHSKKPTPLVSLLRLKLYR